MKRDKRKSLVRSSIWERYLQLLSSICVAMRSYPSSFGLDVRFKNDAFVCGCDIAHVIHKGQND